MDAKGGRLATVSALVLLAVGAAVTIGDLRGQRGASVRSSPTEAGLATSLRCQGCHRAFYERWSTSFHGLAMRPFSAAFAREQLLPQRTPLTVGGGRYRMILDDPAGGLLEESGPAGVSRWPLVQVLGGKNVCYFLTARERGFLQVLPVAWDVRRREWFATPDSAVRHLAGARDQALPWTDRAYTFNTACHGCHVSQTQTNYDPASDSYRTTWAEPGINCETCHGHGAAHAELFERLSPGASPPRPAILSIKGMTVAQRIDLCASCHAKAGALGPAFGPGASFYDHFDLVTLESPDYYPDGRDLGENYTFTSWLMSPCQESGTLDCLHCHTSSGRFRFTEWPNEACLPCHEARVREVAAHSRHAPDRSGGRCVDCHMPTTEFARMRRSDHSLRPPVPAASLAFGSPNACTVCHAGRSAAWADRVVKGWRAAPPLAASAAAAGRWEGKILREGRLVASARGGDWSRLGAMLAYLTEPGRDTVVTASLARLLAACPDPARLPVLRVLVRDPSPLVRAAAVVALAGDATSRGLSVAATGDEQRLVRARAAEALATEDLSELGEALRGDVQRATEELERSLEARPDQFAGHYTLGNLDLGRGRLDEAATHYRRAIELRPDHVESLVNLAMAEARRGRLADAEPPLRTAIRADARNVPARLNLALLLAETGRNGEAEAELNRVLEAEPLQAQALHNLATLLAQRDPRRALGLARRAAQAAPAEPRYAWTAAWLALQAGDASLAVRLLQDLVEAHPRYADGWRLLGAALVEAGRNAEAAAVYRRAAPGLPEGERRALEAEARRVE